MEKLIKALKQDFKKSIKEKYGNDKYGFIHVDKEKNRIFCTDSFRLGIFKNVKINVEKTYSIDIKTDEICDYNAPDVDKILYDLEHSIDKVKSVIINTKEFLNVLKNIKDNYKTAKSVILSFEHNKLIISMYEVKDKTYTLNIDYTDDKTYIALDYKFLLDFFKRVKDETVKLNFINKYKPIWVFDTNTYDFLLMPMILRYFER